MVEFSYLDSPRKVSLTPTPSHTLTLSPSHPLTLTHSHTHTLTHSHTYTLTHSHTLAAPPHDSHTHTFTYSHTHTLTHSHTLTPSQRPRMTTAVDMTSAARGRDAGDTGGGVRDTPPPASSGRIAGSRSAPPAIKLKVKSVFKLTAAGPVELS